MTWDSALTPGGLTFSNGDLTVTRTSGDPNQYRWVPSTVSRSVGKRYFEVRAVVSGDVVGETAAIGLTDAGYDLESYIGSDGIESVGYYANGSIWHDGSAIDTIGSYGEGDWTRCAVNFDTGQAWFGNESGWDGNPAAGTGPTWTFTPNTELFAGFGLWVLDDQITANFGQVSFHFAPPAGFSAWMPLPVTGELAASEAPDSFTAAGAIGHVGTMTVTEALDEFAAVGLVLSNQSGTMAAIEAPDGAAASGVIGHHGTMAASEAEDIATIVGRLPMKGAMAAGEAPDTFSAAGIVPYPPITAFLQRSSPGPFITMFQLDLTQLGGEVLYFTAGTHVDPATGEIREIEFEGNVYVPLPIVATGFEKSSKGPLARPRLQVGNVKNFVTTLLNDHGGLLGAKLTRIRTLAQYLDDGPMPDPGQVLPYETYILSRKVEHNKIAVTFELRAAIDIEGVVCPKRVLLRQCSARYRTFVGNDWVYDTSDMACPYTDEVYFDVNNALTTDPTKDNCPRTIPACKARFGENAVLPFIGFPGAARSR